MLTSHSKHLEMPTTQTTKATARLHGQGINVSCLGLLAAGG